MSIYGETFGEAKWGASQEAGPRHAGRPQRSSIASSYFGERPLPRVPEHEGRPSTESVHSERRLQLPRGRERHMHPSLEFSSGEKDLPVPRAARHHARRPVQTAYRERESPANRDTKGQTRPPMDSATRERNRSVPGAERSNMRLPIDPSYAERGLSVPQRQRSEPRPSFESYEKRSVSPLQDGRQRNRWSMRSSVVGSPRDSRHQGRQSFRSSFVAPPPEPGQRRLSVGSAYGLPSRRPGQRSSFVTGDAEKVWSVFEVFGFEDQKIGKVNSIRDESTRKGSDSLPQVEAQKTPDSPKRPLWLDVALIVVLCFAQIMAQASLAQSVIPLQYISESLGVTDAGQQSWFTAAFSLTAGSFILPAGRLGDMYGHKTVFLIGLAFYGLVSIICGVSVYSNLILLSIARALQGIGSSLMVPNALALLGREFDGFKRNLVFSLFGACAPLGYQIGAVFTGIFAQFLWWPWTFFATAIFSVFYLSIAYFVIPRCEDDAAAAGKLQFDWAGCLLGISGLILFNFAWNQAGVVGWQEPYTYSLLIVSMLLLCGFVYVELHFAEKPLVPVRSLSRTAVLALLCSVAGWASFGVWVWFSQEFLMVLRGATPLLVVAETFPLAVAGGLAAFSTAFLLPRLRPGVIMTIAMLAFCVGNILMATAPIDQTYWAQFFPMCLIMPFGMDMSFPAGTVILSSGMSREDQGVAASLITTTVNYSISLSLGIAGTITRQLSGSSTDPQVVLFGFRGAFYFAIGLDVAGILIALYFIFIERGQKVSNG